MENDVEIMDLLNDLYENISEAIKPILDAIERLGKSLANTFLEAWEEVKYNMNFFDKNISRKRFIKLLMSVGYQRNTANKIAWKYHKEKGEYTLLDFLIENQKKEDLKNYMVRKFGDRVAMNTPIQGTAADIMKIAMVKVYNELKDGGYKSKVILQVHDELVIEAEKSEIEDVKKILVSCMEGASKLLVPLKVEVAEGENWYEAK